MKDLIAKQTASLMPSSRSLDSATSKISPPEQELLDGQQDDSSKVLKDILKSINKMMFAVEATADDVAEIKSLMKQSGKPKGGSMNSVAAMAKSIEVMSLVRIAKSTEEIDKHTEEIDKHTDIKQTALESPIAPKKIQDESTIQQVEPTKPGIQQVEPAIQPRKETLIQKAIAPRIEPRDDDIIDVEAREVPTATLISKPSRMPKSASRDDDIIDVEAREVPTAKRIEPLALPAPSAKKEERSLIALPAPSAKKEESKPYQLTSTSLKRDMERMKDDNPELLEKMNNFGQKHPTAMKMFDKGMTFSDKLTGQAVPTAAKQLSGTSLIAAPTAKRARSNDIIDVEAKEVKNPAPLAIKEGKEDPFAAQVAAESGNETLALMQKQVELLQGILEALGGTGQKQQPKAGEKKEGKGMFDFSGGIAGFGKSIAKGLFGALKKFALGGILAAVAYGLVDGVKAFFNGASFIDSLIAGLGGFLEFLTFGLIDKDTLMNIKNNIGALWDEYIVQPFNNFVDGIKKAFDEYIVQPISNLVTTISNMFDEYIVQPITSFLDTISKAFDEYFVQPILNFANSVTTMFDEYFVKPIGAFVDAINGVFTAIYDKIKSFASKIPGLGGLFEDKKPAPAANTGITSATPTGAQRSSAASVNQSTASVAPAANAQQISATQAPPAQSSASIVKNNGAGAANSVYNNSSNNASSRDAMITQPASGPTIISAPSTNVQNKQNITMPQPVRNPDVSFTNYMKRNRIF